MKRRLVAQKRPAGVIFPASEVWAMDPEAPLPEGWDEVEIVTGIPFVGTALVKERGGFDLCECGDDRRSHDKHVGRCLARKHATNCECLRFREKRQ